MIFAVKLDWIWTDSLNTHYRPVPAVFSVGPMINKWKDGISLNLRLWEICFGISVFLSDLFGILIGLMSWI